MILITGGAGFIGSNFARLWLGSTSEPIVNLDKLTYAGNLLSLQVARDNPNHHFVRGDISDGVLISRLLKDHQPRALINFAAETHVDRSIAAPADFIQTNVVGTYTLLEAARAYWAQLLGAQKTKFRFIQVSTDEVYGALTEGEAAFTEENPFRPNSPYSASKASSDHFVRAWYHTYDLPVVTMNCSNNYGPYQFPEKLIPLVIRHALAGLPLPVYGDGMQIRDWLFVEDHCRAVMDVLEKGAVGETYNIGGNTERPNIEVVRTLCAILDEARPRADGVSYASQIQFVKDRPGHDRRYAVNASKVMEELKWRPRESFESGIAKTVAWYLGNQEWVQQVTSGAYRQWTESQYDF